MKKITTKRPIKKFKKISIRFKFISPLSFDKNTIFYYQITKLLKIVEKKNIFPLMKITDDDIDILNQEITFLEEKINYNDKMIIIDSDMAKLINEWNPPKKYLSGEELIIKKILENSKDRVSLSCRKISTILKEEYNLSICKSKVHLILKNRLNYSYRKTSIKNSKIITENSIKMATIYLKIILRAIKLKYELIFIDESKIQQINPNLYCWRKSEEFIFHNIKSLQKANLIMAVSPNGLVYHHITSNNVDSLEFKKFFDGLLKYIGVDRKKNSIFIFDNLSVHISSIMKKYYLDNSVNILTNIPYLSPFNLIELSFRKIKQKLYRKLYDDIKGAINDTELILKSEDFINDLSKEYLSTLNEYNAFIKKYIKKDI